VASLDSATQLEPPRGAVARSRCGLVVERRAGHVQTALGYSPALSAVLAPSLAMPLGGCAGFARAAV
jgi:hypothetical protein